MAYIPHAINGFFLVTVATRMNKLMKPSTLFAVLAVAALFSQNAFSASDIKAGEYVRKGGTGTLSVKPSAANKQAFAIQAFGANTHICDLDGDIRQNKAILDTGDGDKKCVVSFQVTKQGIDVIVDESAHEQCRYFCGARASFDGKYLMPENGCADSERQASRKRFIGFYKQKNYASARAQLEPLLQKCSQTLHRFEDGDIRNDLAITQYHLNDFAGCLKTLEPLAEYAGLSLEQLKENFAPSDADVMAPIAKSARTNISLCSAKPKTK